MGYHSRPQRVLGRLRGRIGWLSGVGSGSGLVGVGWGLGGAGVWLGMLSFQFRDFWVAGFDAVSVSARLRG